VVGLVGVATRDGWSAPSALDAQVWRERVASLEDPFLGVEPLEPAS
jgi:hypothetical protein